MSDTFDNESNASNTEDYVDSVCNMYHNDYNKCDKNSSCDGDSSNIGSDDESCDKSCYISCDKPNICKFDKLVQFTFTGVAHGWQPLLGFDYASNIMGGIVFSKSALCGFTLEKGNNGILNNGRIYIIKTNKLIQPINGINTVGCLGIIHVNNISNTNDPLYFGILPNEKGIKINHINCGNGNNNSDNGTVTWEVSENCGIDRGDSLGIYVTGQCGDGKFYSLHGCIFTMYLSCE